MKFFKKHKYFLLMLWVLCIGAFLMFLPSILQGKYFIGGGDVKTQWYPFYTLNRRTTINALRDRTLPFYSFVLFLGNNIWASKSSYGLFDIYNVLTYVLNKDYFYIYDLQCLIKILVAGISMYLLIDYLYKNKRVSFIGGLSFGLSSFAIYFTSQPGFLSFYSLFPFYILGMEKYLKDNKKYLFIISVFVLLITNYYFFYALSLFSPIYFIYRYYNLHGNLKGVVKKALILIVYYLIGVLLSGFIILPAFLYVIQNERVGGLSFSLTYSDLSVYLHLFVSAFVPSHTYIYGNNIFDLGAHTLKEICLYSGTLITLIISQVFKDSDKKYFKSTLIVYGIMLMALFIPFIGSIINGFSEPCFRWLFIFVYFNILVACRYLNDFSLIDNVLLRNTLIVEIIIVILVYALGLLYKGYSISDYKIQLFIFIGSILFMLANYYCFCKGKNYLVICIVELCLFSYMYGSKSLVTSISDTDLDGVTSVLADNDNYHNLRDYLNTLDEGNENEYFRVYVPYDSLYWSFSHDLGIIYNISGLMTYDSTYSQSFNDMRSLNYDGVVENIDWEFNIKDENIINFLSTKYSITSNLDEIPFSEYEVVDDSYRGSLIVAKNLNYRDIVSTYSKYTNKASDTSLLSDYVISDQKVSVGSGNYTLSNVAYYDNYFTCLLNSEGDGFAIVGLPYDSGWKIMINGEKVDYIKCNGGMMGFKVNAGDNNIEMYFTPSGFKAGMILTLIGSLSFVGLIVFDIRKRHENI